MKFHFVSSLLGNCEIFAQLFLNYSQESNGKTTWNVRRCWFFALFTCAIMWENLRLALSVSRCVLAPRLSINIMPFSASAILSTRIFSWHYSRFNCSDFLNATAIDCKLMVRLRCLSRAPEHCKSNLDEFYEFFFLNSRREQKPKVTNSSELWSNKCFCGVAFNEINLQFRNKLCH